MNELTLPRPSIIGGDPIATRPLPSLGVAPVLARRRSPNSTFGLRHRSEIEADLPISCGAGAQNRTVDLLITNQLLYP